MTRIPAMLLSRSALVLALLAAAAPLARAQQWIQPTAEELSMTAAPQAPGAPAIYLFREQTTDDDLHMYSFYARVKVLNVAGEDRANVEIRYLRGNSADFTIDEVAGRTIHPDGKVIPFTGKPFEKLIENKGDGLRYMARVLSLPDVTPGSIIEYRYKLRYSDFVFSAPYWFVQDDLFTRRVHYSWKPTNQSRIENGREQTISTIAWTPILPAGDTVQRTNGFTGAQTFQLTADNIPAIPREEHMPPIDSLSYRVLFYYTPYRTAEEFWNGEGKYWAKQQEKFIGPGSGIRSAVADLTTPSDTPDWKLRKLYAATAKIENTDYTRSHSRQEDKAEGLREVHTSDDIWRRRRGDSTEIAETFIAMARAAGFKAYPMAIARRDRGIFYERFLNLNQLNDTIAIVNVDGKDMLFDPGVRFCPYGHLAWQHMHSGGLREIYGGTTIANLSGDQYTDAHVKRIADLTMDAHGVVTGSVSLEYTGSAALHWRTVYANNDEPALRHDLTEHLQHLLPGGMSVNLTSLANVEQPEQPLIARFQVSGAVGSSTGKRLLLPADLFVSSPETVFPHEKRETPVAFEYPSFLQDAVRIKLPPNLAIESLPATSKVRFKEFATYDLSAKASPTSFLTFRNYALGEILFKTDEYPDLRKFFQTMEGSDQQTIVLRQSTNAANGASSPAPHAPGS